MEEERQKGGERDFWDLAWHITKIVTAIVTASLVPLLGYYFTNEYNKKQLEISRGEIIAGIIPQLASEDMNSQKRKAIALSLAVFKEFSIPPIISFLEDEDEATRMASASALEMIGKECVGPLNKFLLNEFIPARFKGESIMVLEKIDKNISGKVKKEMVAQMS